MDIAAVSTLYPQSVTSRRALEVFHPSVTPGTPLTLRKNKKCALFKRVEDLHLHCAKLASKKATQKEKDRVWRSQFNEAD